MNESRCPNCGLGTHNEHESAWTDLQSYEYNIYPDSLIVVTNASLEQFNEAVDAQGKSHEEGDPKNIEVILQERGFIAVAAQAPKHTITF